MSYIMNMKKQNKRSMIPIQGSVFALIVIEAT